MKSSRKGNQTSRGGQGKRKGKGKGKSSSEGDKDKNKRDCQNGASNIREIPSLMIILNMFGVLIIRRMKPEQKKETPGSSGDKTKLVLKDNIKAGLCTNCGLLDEQVASMIK
eukprot:15161129-Ditylum_brightwellii.AAC.1